jgi:hypothetical protein
VKHPWYVRALLVEPDRVLAHLARMRARGVVDVEPTPWQLCLGVLRLWHRLAFRTDTVGTSHGARIRPTWRARLLHWRGVRLPFLLAERAVHPLDFTGLRSDPDRLMRHLLGAHHDRNQFVFDLELMVGHGTLEELQARVTRVVDGTDPRAGWLRDLTVFEGYHEHLAAAVDDALAGGPAMSASEADDPDLTLRGAMRWCARQPATPAATFAAWRAGTFRLDSDARIGLAAARMS